MSPGGLVFLLAARCDCVVSNAANAAKLQRCHLDHRDYTTRRRLLAAAPLPPRAARWPRRSSQRACDTPPLTPAPAPTRLLTTSVTPRALRLSPALLTSRLSPPAGRPLAGRLTGPTFSAGTGRFIGWLAVYAVGF